jgi:hypothetical protein
MEVIRDWSAFSPQAYLHEYYADIGAENLALLQFLQRAFRDVPQDSLLLDFGGGPTIYTLITASRRVSEIHFCDYLESNLEAVQQWLHGRFGAFDWTHFVKTTLVLEGQDYSRESVRARENQIRQSVTQVMRCDANRPDPLNGINWQYDVLVSNFCAESATNDRAQWRRFVRNITSLLKPGGKLVMSTLKGADSYAVGDEIFPAVFILEDDLIEVLCHAGFVEDSIQIESVPADRPSRHYQGLMLTTATKCPNSHHKE